MRLGLGNGSQTSIGNYKSFQNPSSKDISESFRGSDKSNEEDQPLLGIDINQVIYIPLKNKKLRTEPVNTPKS